MGEEQQSTATNRLLTKSKEEEKGERILGPTRRPDGTLRKPIRIRAGYTPQEEVAIYQSKGVLLKKAQPSVPPGFDAESAAVNKPKTKAAKRNEKRKEKKQQAALVSSSDQSGKDADSDQISKQKSDENLDTESEHISEIVETVVNQTSNLSISSTSEVCSLSSDQIDASKCESKGQDIDKRIRALKKKIRIAEAQLNADPANLKPEQLEKLTKMEGWRDELKILEAKKATSVS